LRIPGVQILVHPECQHEVVAAADVVGSTEAIIKTVTESAAGSKWAVGTELNLVQRLARTNPDKEVVFLDKTVCYCSTMNRIDLPHLVWAMETILGGRVVNEIRVNEEVAKFSRIALDRMLALPNL
jgi:quinolinate synthase